MWQRPPTLDAVTLLDLDRPAPQTRARRPRWIAAAVASSCLLLAASTAVVARQPGTPEHVVTITATPRDRAAAQIMTVTDKITPPWGQPVRLDQQPETISVITWAGTSGASCTIWLDGRVVAESTAGAEGQPASCVWPE